MNPKIRKLLEDPTAFARDMVSNRVTDVKRMLPRTQWQRDARRYSVVAAVFGVEKYLDEFFRSMVRQTVGFEGRIQLILVDDGSPDGSAEIIARWQKQYPRSIRYVRKENGGQASARNVGLEHATGDWVTFIDPDDFVDAHYFERVDRFLDGRKNDDVALVSCNMIFYWEKTGEFSDSHPLRYRFRRGERVVRASALESDIQLSASSAFLQRRVLRDSQLRFDEEIRPSFEDGHLVTRYLLAAGDGGVGFVPSAKYYYRKRADESSTLDGSWSHPGRFGVVLERGYLEVLRASESTSADGRAARSVQRTVLYELIWYIKQLVDNAESVSFLSDEQRARFKQLVAEIVSKIDDSTILEFDLAGAWLYHKIGILGLWKGSRPEFEHVYVEDYDPIKNQVRLRYFYRGDAELEAFMVDGREVFPAFAKVRAHDFLGDVFVVERLVWLPVQDLNGKLEVSIGNRDARMIVRGKVHRRGLALREVARLRRAPDPAKLTLEARMMQRAATTKLARGIYSDAFVFMDRDTQADDNAEHLYRYVHQNRPDINAFFVLRRSSHDWDRLHAEGFRLLAFGSLQHRLALQNASHLISSHADHYVVGDPIVQQRIDLRELRFTFLQHGVIKDDLSKWLNGRPIDCFVTASPAEHASIVGTGTRYKFSAREVVLTGLPRHDALGAGTEAPQRLLVIMPTWRQSLAGAMRGAGSERELNPAFYESQFAQAWKALLHSPALRALVDEHGYQVQFFPHANIQPYLSWFAPPAHVETCSHGADRSIQHLLRAASIVLTDYSSIVFDAAYLRRAVLYYQFDRDLVFGGGHTTRKGYFDYERDGFGPVCTDERALLDALAEIVAAGAVPAPEYLARVDRTFAYRDGGACERTLDAILALDRRTHPNDQSAQLLVEAARAATGHRAWSRAETRWSRVLAGPPETCPPDAELRLIEALRELGKLDEADARLHALESRGEQGDGLDLERAELASAAETWPSAVLLWTKRARASTGDDRIHAQVRLAEACRRLGAFAEAGRALAGIDCDVDPPGARAERAELATALERWDEAVERWEEIAQAAGAPPHALVRLADVLARLGRTESALTAIEAYLENPYAGRDAPKYERQARALRLTLARGLRAPRADDVHAPPARHASEPNTNVAYLGRHRSS